MQYIYSVLHHHNNKPGERGSQKQTINNFNYYPVLLYNAISYYWLLQGNGMAAISKSFAFKLTALKCGANLIKIFTRDDARATIQIILHKRRIIIQKCEKPWIQGNY